MIKKLKLTVTEVIPSYSELADETKTLLTAMSDEGTDLLYKIYQMLAETTPYRLHLSIVKEDITESTIWSKKHNLDSSYVFKRQPVLKYKIVNPVETSKRFESEIGELIRIDHMGVVTLNIKGETCSFWPQEVERVVAGE